MLTREELKKAYQEVKDTQHKFEEFANKEDELDCIKSIQKDRAEALKNLADAIDKVLWELYEDRNCDY